VFGDVLLSGFFSMNGGVEAVSGREVSVMPGGLVVALLVVFGRMFVMFRSLLMMLGGFFVLFGAFVLCHIDELLVLVVTVVARRGCAWQRCRRASRKIDDGVIALA
jgi:hypothetical protein